MKKPTETPPIDDLFARKLGNMSLSPSPDGFERLQARMGQKKPEAKAIFWRNPILYGYVAAAACIAVVFLFGWQYWSSGNSSRIGGNEVAITRSGHSGSQKSIPHSINEKNDQQIPNEAELNQPELDVADEVIKERQVADVPKESPQNRFDSVKKQLKSSRNRTLENAVDKSDLPTLAQKTKTPEAAPIAPASIVPIEQPVIAVNKPAPAAERVLEVTIAEPEALAEARQIAKTTVEDKPLVAANEKHEKETKAGNLWQQVKRFKQGEVFARGENTENERSLLGRAYSGLKHTLDKDKAAKQD
ncbi:hypothetical protein WBJ53_01480 [Spirosoma sp. SC4-14]|uniref:hypothetical protein n=1 Tax=Spirosoma sp. SC4-14 TaxID=3128900 RepID=UPI0030D41376